MLKLKGILLLVLLPLLNLTAQDLARRANWQADISNISGKPGALVNAVDESSPLDRAGVLPGDIILKVNGRTTDSAEDWSSIYYALRGDQPTHLLVRRGSVHHTINVVLEALPREQHKDKLTLYESVVNDYGVQQRTITTIPEKGDGPFPAIFIVQGLSCSSIEAYPGRQGNWVKMLNALAEAEGFVVMRVEKAGVGDSEGDCADTDFITELEGYRAALRSLLAKPYVDSSRVVVYGSSMGSALAPVLANEFELSGVVSDGTFYKSWFEHMLEIERRIKRMEGDDAATIAQKMKDFYIPLYYEMLVEGKSYAEIMQSRPGIKPYMYHSPNHMYGRPLRYYQQVQAFDFASQWASLKAPIRILRGEHDWIMSYADNEMIMDLLDAVGHEDHRLHVYPGLDHWNTIHDSPDDSYHGNPGKWDPKLPALVIEWIREMVEEKR